MTKDFKEWLMYTLGMGALPSILKALILYIFSQPILIEEFRVELFFLTIIFFVDALKKCDKSSGTRLVIQFILLISMAVYTIILLGDMNLFNKPLSSVVITWVLCGFLGASFIFDFIKYLR